MSTLTKAEIVEQINQKIGLSKSDAGMLVENFFEELSTQLEAGHALRFSGFGNFTMRDKNERPGRNPRTGAEVVVAPRRIVSFHAGRKLKALVEDSRAQIERRR